MRSGQRSCSQIQQIRIKKENQRGIMNGFGKPVLCENKLLCKAISIYDDKRNGKTNAGNIKNIVILCLSNIYGKKGSGRFQIGDGRPRFDISHLSSRPVQGYHIDCGKKQRFDSVSYHAPFPTFFFHRIPPRQCVLWGCFVLHERIYKGKDKG